MIERCSQYCRDIPRGGIVRGMPISAFDIFADHQVREQPGPGVGLRQDVLEQRHRLDALTP